MLYPAPEEVVGVKRVLFTRGQPPSKGIEGFREGVAVEAVREDVIVGEYEVVKV